MSLTLGLTPPSSVARLAIKPERVRRVLGATGLQRRRDPCHRNQYAAHRWLATQTKLPADNHPLAYTWLTRTPEEITPDDVLSTIPSLSGSRLESKPIPIILVTPSFAPWVDTSHTFLEQWINRLYHNPPGDSNSSTYAFVAIVDRLPDTSREPGNASKEGAREYEGISVLFSSAENIQGKAAAPRRLRATDAPEAAFVFSVQTDTNATNEGTRPPIHEVGLRLANTIFLNGKENTLFGTRWGYNASSSGYNLDQVIDLSRCLITSNTESIHTSLGLPLYPVGRRRRVVTSMGNILRQITKHADGQSMEPMPASTELEKELPRYIEEHDITDHRVSVWALIEGPDQHGADRSPDDLTKALQAGGKLHHVMSGGGGWGKKQGLLSLDPEISFLAPSDDGEPVSLNGLFSPQAEDSLPDRMPSLDRVFIDDLSSLSQVARAGDYIQFFVSVSSGHEQDRSDRSLVPEEALSCHFGVVADAESPMASPSTSLERKDLIQVPNHFGALSEKAVTYLQPIVPAKSEGELLESSTKLNMAGARISLALE
ncbi:hypothetical protein P170DRAFT_349457 [Aspergillus steynii IBT 23096]|uniref:V-type ATPase n=1 Tax=Aspergillus steynii IBT 23096 TaxID=1392250 RepID=A0A2I2GJT8_9EURO|nr:uncharacterized protein P170DRAFT_349457 [Aspergillus steynii IBT 23096]PLB53146.1 hypothetical protein P170DRAFT_349457 [Aspergillus steynii IBT 23096]